MLVISVDVQTGERSERLYNAQELVWVSAQQAKAAELALVPKQKTLEERIAALEAKLP